MSQKPKILIVTGYGVSNEAESAYAWELAGAKVTKLHLNDLLEKPKKLQDFQGLMFAGGFPFGDQPSSGHILALRWRCHLAEELQRFRETKGLILGIASGFHALLKLNLLPEPELKRSVAQTALTQNTSGVFQNLWVTLKFDTAGACIFTKDLDHIDLPIRHSEGRFLALNSAAIPELTSQGCIPCRYIHPKTGKPTMSFPYNPSGSQEAIAGLCSRDGLVFGLMPQPEAYLFPENHPQWQRQKLAGKLPEQGKGLLIFKNAVKHLQ